MINSSIPQSNRSQQQNVFNLLKGFACICVVFIHVRFPGIVGDVINKLSQYAVPAFLMISGYFSFSKDESVIKRRLLKILKIFIVAYICFFGYNILLNLMKGSVLEWLSVNFNFTTPVKYVLFCTIDFAHVLWYLIAMIETYLVWYFVVKYKKEHACFWLIPLLFILRIVLMTYCESKNLPWMYKINFLTCAMPFFLFGHYLHRNEKFFKTIRFLPLFCAILIGGLIALIPVLFDVPINFSCVGVIIYSLGIFILVFKLPNKSFCKPMEYIGNKLSLNIYVFHLIILSMLTYMFHFLHVDLQSGILGWIRPVLVVGVTMMLAQVLGLLKKRL